MFTNMLRKVINEDAYTNKAKLEESDDLALVYNNLNEIEFRQLVSSELGDERAWSEALNKLITWKENHDAK